MKLYTLGLLALSSFNALGSECLIKASDKSSYTIKSSIYSYSSDTNINTCKCQAKYKFNTYVSEGKVSHISSLSFKSETRSNAFKEPSGFAEKQLRCVILKDDTKLSTAEWVIPISLLSVTTMSVPPLGYYYIKLRSKASGLSGGTSNIETGDDLPLTNIEPQVDLDNVSISTNVTEYEDIIPIYENMKNPINPINPTNPMDQVYVNTQIESTYSEINVRNMLSDDEVALMPSATADARLETRPPLPKRTYNEISNNVNLNSRTQCNIQ
ncbi:hypothetical protein [uncultured Gammaproteobacteria bacterium]|jgi:hypothetical protein|nr:hypothetical protein [uncultured Gammaproteobacteria bacterium]